MRPKWVAINVLVLKEVSVDPNLDLGEKVIDHH